MALANGVVGARHSAQRITWMKDDGAPYDLTGAILTARLLDKAGARNADGVFAVDPNQAANPGVFTWSYGALDVGTPGIFKVQFIATYADSKNDKTFTAYWTVEEAI